MKITIEHDDGKVEVFQEALDVYLAVRQIVTLVKESEDNTPPLATLVTKSYSWGSNLREIVKELRQSTIELEGYIKSVNAEALRELKDPSNKLN